MHTRRSLVALAAALFATVGLAADAVTVTQKGLAFAPNELSAAKGQTVEFVNDDTTAHNIMITGDGVAFNGGLQPPGGKVKYTFTKPGTYIVGCGIHPKMQLTITVN
jgi:cytochrome c peroxidase